MKKKIALVSLVAVLLLAGLAGAVYATVDHQVVQGQKLIGVGQLGKMTRSWGTVQFSQSFRFTNPDGVGEITITQVSVIKGDETVIYEGPFIRVRTVDDILVRTVITDPMSPHEIRYIGLRTYMWKGTADITDPSELEKNSNWYSIGWAHNQTNAPYTVEIAWEAEGAVNPLTGWQQTQRWENRPDDPITFHRMFAESPMVNLKQKKGLDD